MNYKYGYIIHYKCAFPERLANQSIGTWEDMLIIYESEIAVTGREYIA